MSKPLDERYFIFLYSQVGDLKIKNPALTYWRLSRQLFTKQFFWVVPNDDNRISDGIDLRAEFVDSTDLGEVDQDWLRLGCSMFEMMIGLSRRLSFEANGEPRDWYWHIASNVGLHKYTDLYKPDTQTVDDILESLIWRNYQADGHGGFFPLRRPKEDQRKVELWYQMSAYILEADEDEGRTNGFLQN